MDYDEDDYDDELTEERESPRGNTALVIFFICLAMIFFGFQLLFSFGHYLIFAGFACMLLSGIGFGLSGIRRDRNSSSAKLALTLIAILAVGSISYLAFILWALSRL